MPTSALTSLKRYKEIGEVLYKWGFGTTFLEDLSPGLKAMNVSTEAPSEHQRDDGL